MMTKKRLFAALIPAALAGAMTLTTLTGCSGGGTTTSTLTPTNAAAGVLLLSVNPEIELAYDQAGNTLSLTGQNDDGVAVLTDYNGYQGKPADDVIQELIDRIYEGGYFEGTVDGHPKNLVLKLENGSQYPSDDFLNTIAADAKSTLEARQVSSQTFTVDQDDYDDRYREQGYINAQTAEDILATQLQRNDLQFVQKDYDIDDGTYEIEFVLDGVEYEYEVNASTGKVLEVDRERHNANDDWGDDINDDDWNDRHHIQSNTAAQTSTSQTSPASGNQNTQTSQPTASSGNSGNRYDDDWDDRYDDDWDDRYDDDWDDRYDDDWDDVGENRSDDWDDDHDDDRDDGNDDWDDDDNDDWDDERDDVGENRSDDWDDDHD